MSTRVEIPHRVAEPSAAVQGASSGAQALRGVGRFCRRKPLGALGGFIVIALLVMAVFAEQLAPYGYDETVRGSRMKPPSAAHWLGTDNLSRDMWSRIVFGARVSVTVGVATVGLAVFLATAVGVSSGYFGGAYDLVVQRVVDAWLSFPYLVIVLSVMAVLGPGLLNVVLSLAIIIAAVNSRVIRGATITIAQGTYVEAARALGCGHARILVRHILPNVTATIILLATIAIGDRAPSWAHVNPGGVDGEDTTGPDRRAPRSLLAAPRGARELW